MKKRNLKLLSMLLAVVMLISMIDFSAFAAYSDTQGHWADAQISKWSDLGILHGDGKNFRPDDPVTRGEIAAILNNLMQYQAKSENKFSDLGSQWYTDAILGANASGIIVGNNNKVRPEDNATREEAAVMLSKALAVKGGGAAKFIDNVKISAWAVDAVNAMAEKGYISGFPDGNFRPKAKITRAEVAAIVNNAVNGFYNKAGTYTENVNGTAVVNTNDVILKGINIKGDLILAEGIGNGDVTLDNVTINGNTVVRGGGENSIIIKNSSKLGTVTVCRIDGKISVKVQDSAEVEMIIVDDGSDDVTVTGEVGNLQVDAPNITVTAKAAVLSKVEISGKNTVLVIDEKSSANKIAFNKGANNSTAIINGTAKSLVSETAGLKVKGDGKLETAEIRGNDNKVTVMGAKVTAAAGITGTFAGEKAVASGTSEIVQKTETDGSMSSGSTTPTPSENKVSIAENGVEKASVVISSTADTKIKDAANKLIEYIQKSTGVTLPVISESEAEISQNENSVLIYVGHIGKKADRQIIEAQLADLDDDGFVIKTEKSANVITIIGPTNWGTEFGVYEFLERYVGVRWLMPGPDGEDVPINKELSIPEETIRQEPSFISRHYDGTALSSPNRLAWARYNRIHQRVDQNHIFYALMPPSKYQSEHPDFYPEGNSLITSDGGWQIRFSNPETIDFVANLLIEYFNNNPEATGHSLSVNDSGGFCEADPKNPYYPDELNSIGQLNMSNIYYPWVNEVAKKVFAVHPDKNIGVIAYGEVYDPPTNVVLHPNVFVFITDERLSWEDPEVAQKSKAFTERWKEAAPSVAFYEYLGTSYYALPRTFFHRLSENYKYAEQIGAVAQVSEMHPMYGGDGPKPWIASKLQWDASADVDALLDEWYIRAVGEEAAPYLKQYFAFWDKFWEERIIQSSWFSKWKTSSPRSNYLNFLDTSYLSLVTEQEMALNRGLLENVVDKAVTPEQKARADVFLKAFEYYEASALSYTTNKPLEPFTSSDEVIAALDKMEIKVNMAQYRLELYENYQTNDLLRLALDPRNFGMYWSGVNSDELDMIIRWIKEGKDHGEAAEYIQEISTSTESEIYRHYLKFIIAEVEDQPELNENASFEKGIEDSINDAPPWWYWVEGQGKENIHRSDAIARTGKFSVEAINLTIGGPVVNGIRVEPGFHSLSAYYHVPEGASGKGNISLFVFFWDENNNHLGSIITSNRNAVSTDGQWKLIEWVGVIPNMVNGVAVKKVQVGTWMNYFGENDRIYIDDFKFRRLSDPYTEPPKEEGLIQNGSFEYGGTGTEDAFPWYYWNAFGTGTMKKSNEKAYTSKYSLKSQGILMGSINQVIETPGTGKYTMKARYYVPEGQETKGTIRLFLQYRDANQNYIGYQIPTVHQAVNIQPGQWNQIEWTGDLISEYEGKQAKYINLGVEFGNFGSDEVIYIDDFEFDLAEGLIQNASFENGGDDIAPWFYWQNDGSVGTMKKSNEQAHTSKHSLKSQGVTLGSINQVIENPGTGKYTMKAQYYVPEGQDTKGTIRLFLQYRDANQNYIGYQIPTVHQAVNIQPGQWNQIEWTGDLISEYDGKQAKYINLGVEFGNFGSDEVIYIDDVELNLAEGLMQNASFENVGDDISPWFYWQNDGSTGTMEKSNERAYTSQHSLKSQGVTMGSINQVIENPGTGKYRMTAQYYVPEGQETKGTIKLFLQYREAYDTYIGYQIPTVHQAVNIQPGQWNQIEWTGDIISEYEGKQARYINLGVEFAGFGSDEAIYIDDVELVYIGN